MQLLVKHYYACIYVLFIWLSKLYLNLDIFIQKPSSKVYVLKNSALIKVYIKDRLYFKQTFLHTVSVGGKANIVIVLPT